MRTIPIAALLLFLGVACGEPEVEVAEDSSAAEDTQAAGGSATPVEDARRIEKGDGLVVEIVAEGSGVVLRRDHDVRIHYRGRVVETGLEFGSSYADGMPLVFTLGRGVVMKGWDRALVGLRAGTRLTLHVPAALAYGEKGQKPGIPPNADLEFDIHVLEAR